MIKVAILGLGARGGEVYGLFAFNNPIKFVISAICDVDKNKVEKYKQKFNMKSEQCYGSSEAFFACGKMADVLIICTDDDMRFYHSMAALKIGYHLLLEKPIADNLDKCIEIMNMAKELNRVVLVSHVLMHTKYFSAIKNLIDSKIVGEIIKIKHVETTKCLPKSSCYDFDVLTWLINKKCVEVLSYENTENLEGGQKLIFKFEGGITASIALTASPNENKKKTIIHGVNGIAEANYGSNKIKIINLLGIVENKQIDADIVGNSVINGEFESMMEYLYKLLSNPITYDDFTRMIEESIYSHILAFAAIESEKVGEPILISKFVKDSQK